MTANKIKVPSRKTNAYCCTEPLCKPRMRKLRALVPQARKSKKPSTMWRSNQAMGLLMWAKMMRWVTYW